MQAESRRRASVSHVEPVLAGAGDRERAMDENRASRKPQILLPFDIREALTLREAAAIAGRTPVTVRTWCSLYNLGRRIAGQWRVSRVALAMFLDSNREALRAYLNGDRQCEAVLEYFERCGLLEKK
jgi:hypothetical protein